MYHIPVSYIGKIYEDFVPKSKAEKLRDSISKAPTKGKLLVVGNPAPIINQLFESGRRMFGVDFIKYYESRFDGESTYHIPTSTDLLIYNVGAEPARSSEYGARLLNALLTQYSDNFVIVATIDTKNVFETKYGLIFENTVTFKKEKEPKWI